MGVCHECGWAVDIVGSDYGEDLVVQTCLNGQMDPFRTLVQVRATTQALRSKRGRSVLWIKSDHALRWVQSREPVLVAVWNTALRTGCFALPSEQFSEYDLLMSDNSRVALTIDPSRRLDKPTLEQFVWQLRFKYFQERLLAAFHRDQEQFIRQAKGIQRSTNHQSSVPIVIFELLRTLGIVTPAGLSPKIRRWFKNACRGIRRKGATLPVSQRVRQGAIPGMAATLCIFAQVDAVGARGISRILADTGGEFLLRLLRRHNHL